MSSPHPTRPVPAAEFPLPPVAKRFVRYVQVDTTANEHSETVPSSPGQRVLGRLVCDELRDIGLDAHMDDKGYVHAHVPPSGATPAAFTLGFVSHLDTSPDAPGAGVQPFIHPEYDGGEVAFPSGLRRSPAEQPALREHLGHDLITSDGTTLLGSDDKAGVAIIIQLAADLVADTKPRPPIQLLFTIDEEIGRGIDHLDLSRFPADVAYTIDGGRRRTFEFETFNAAEAILTVEGVGVHPGYAKDVLINATRIAAEFVDLLPRNESPETTAGRDGYLHPHEMSGSVEKARVRVLIRDFEEEGFERRKQLLRDLAQQLQEAHPLAHLHLKITNTYRNMKRYIEDTDPRAISMALEAAKRLGYDLHVAPVRGGTDGARLSELGIPTPNIFTGGYDFHSRFEWNTVQNLEAALAYARSLVDVWSDRLRS
ncbi:peptidase T [soil metagenome]